MEKDKEFMYLAKEGLAAEVEEPWEVMYDDSDNIYYYNHQTGESVQDHPMDDVYKKKL